MFSLSEQAAILLHRFPGSRKKNQKVFSGLCSRIQHHIIAAAETGFFLPDQALSFF